MKRMTFTFVLLVALSSISFAQTPKKTTATPPPAPGEKTPEEKKPITSVKDILNLVPKATQMHMKPGPKIDEAIEEANTKLESDLKGKAGTLKFKVDTVTKEKIEDNNMEGRMKSMTVRGLDSAANYVTVHITAHFEEKEADALIKKYRKNTDAAVTGELHAVYRNDTKTGLHMNIDLRKPKIAGKESASKESK